MAERPPRRFSGVPGKLPKTAPVPSLSSKFKPIESGKPPARHSPAKPRARTTAPPPRNSPRKLLPAGLVPVPSPLVHPPIVGRTPPSAPRLLVVDDDPAIRDLLSRVLRRAGWEVETSHDGGQGLQMIGQKAGKYALVLLDLMMPNINGFEVIEHFKIHNPAMLRRIVVITASPKVDEDKIKREMIAGLIEKPFDIEQLVGFLRPLVEERVAAG